jgi:hypothetical protein
MSNAKYTQKDKEQFVELFKSNATDVSRACKAMGRTPEMQRSTFYDWYNNEPWFKAAIDQAREAICDFAESQLLTLMKGIPKLDAQGRITGWVSRPDTACIIFFNKTKNKNRGYDERQILAHEGNWPVDVNINVTTPEEAAKLKEFLNGKPK